LTPFKLHAVYVIVTALMNPAYYWPHLGGMFSDAVADTKGEEAKGRTASQDTPATTDTPAENVASARV
jgi:hypothetical protein